MLFYSKFLSLEANEATTKREQSAIKFEQFNINTDNKNLPIY